MDVAPIVMSSDEEDGDRILHVNDAVLRLRERLLAATTTLQSKPVYQRSSASASKCSGGPF